jgi:hypothetical protein
MMMTRELFDLIGELIDYLTLMRDASGDDNGESRLIAQLEEAQELVSRCLFD